MAAPGGPRRSQPAVERLSSHTAARRGITPFAARARLPLELLRGRRHDIAGDVRGVADKLDARPDPLLRSLYAEVFQYSGGVMRDDVALLMVEL